MKRLYEYDDSCIGSRAWPPAAVAGGHASHKNPARGHEISEDMSEANDPSNRMSRSWVFCVRWYPINLNGQNGPMPDQKKTKWIL